MAGRPKKRLALSQLQQQLLARDDPRVLPAGFRDWPDARKLEWILSASLDQVATVCTWPVSDLDMGRLAIWERVRHGIWMVMLRMSERRLDAAAEAEAVEALRQAMAQRHEPANGTSREHASRSATEIATELGSTGR
jgi:hypothetical protein